MVFNYELTGDKGILENQVNIISAFPGTGKSTATMLLAGDQNYLIRDIDSAEFRANLKRQAGPIDSDTNWFIYYVDYIQSMAKFYEQELKVNPEYDGKTVILFVSSHGQVRSTMTAREMTYYYAVPTVNMFQKFILPAAAARIDAAKDEGDEEKIGSTTRAYEFLSQQGEKMINNVTAETEGNVYERLVWLGSDIRDDEDPEDVEPEYLYYFVHNNTFIGDKLTNVSDRMKVEVFDAIRGNVIMIATHHPEQCEFVITSRGELAIITPKMRIGALADIFADAGVDFMTASNFAFCDSDHIILDRSDAQAIYEILENIVTSDPEGRDDSKLFGEKGISFERLYDSLRGDIYKIKLSSRELVDAQVKGEGYDGVYDYDSENEPAFGKSDSFVDNNPEIVGTPSDTTEPYTHPDAKCVPDDEDDNDGNAKCEED